MKKLSTYLSYLLRFLVFLFVLTVLFMQYKTDNMTKEVRKFYRNHYSNVYNDSVYKDLSVEVKMDFEQLGDNIKSIEMMTEDFLSFTISLSFILILVVIGDALLKLYLSWNKSTQ
jgi:hypothetical protein